jgi:hypothetical protein
MSENSQIGILKTNRFMRSPEEVVAFERALTEMAQNPNSEDLYQLHLILDDACQHPEVMFSLIHFLESFSLQEQLQAFVRVLPHLVKQAAEWTSIIHARIINDAEARVAFEAILQSMNNHQRDEVCQLLLLASVKQSSSRKTEVARSN